MHEWKEIGPIIQNIRVIAEAVKNRKVGAEAVEDMQLSAKELNQVLYHSPKLKFQKDCHLETEEGYQEYIREIEILADIWEQTLQRRKGKAVDAEFWEIYEYFKYVDEKVICQSAIQNFMGLPEGTRIECLSLHHRYTFLNNKIDFVKGNFSLIEEHVHMMAENVEHYRWLYGRLADYRSKKVLNGIIQYWFQFDLKKLHALCETVFADYYDLDILDCDGSDVVVDLGAYTGDSALNYIHTYGAYKKIYAYEITPSVYQSLRKNLSQYPDIIPLQKGVGSKQGTMFVNDGAHKAGNKLLEQGEHKVAAVTLDEDIQEPITVIKMDIEGAEKDAIAGAVLHIKSEKPRMLVSSYHLPEDIFEVPRLIDSIRDDYKFYMRFNGRGCLWPCDYVLFAV